MSNEKVVPMTKHIKPETITLTHLQIEAILSSNAILNTVRKSLPVKQAYWLARAIDKMQRVYKVYKEQQQDIIQAHAQMDDKGKPKADDRGAVLWLEDHVEAATAAVKELQEIEVDLGIDRIAINLDDPGQSFTIEDMLLLLPMIQEPQS